MNRNFQRKAAHSKWWNFGETVQKKDKLTPPHYQAITAAQMARVYLPDNQGRINVIAGDFNGVRGPAQTYTPVNVIDMRINKGGTVTTSFPADYNTALLIINGSAKVNGQSAPHNSF